MITNKRINLAITRPALLPWLVAGIFAIFGVTLATTSMASTFVAHSEAESGAISSAATVRADSGASAGQAVVFGADTNVKSPLKGLLDRRSAPAGVYQDALGGFVVEGRWAELQPTQGGAIVADNAIDQAIADIRAINSAKPGRNLQLKVRLFTGTSAPAWAKNLDGSNTAVSVSDPVDGGTGTIGRFWNDAFGNAYDDFVSKLAAKYDAVPEIREVTVARCMTVYAEPFIRQVASQQTVTNLLDAGYTVAKDKQCHREQLDAHKSWSTTRSSIALSPYQVVDNDSQTATTDVSFTNEMASYCRQSLAQRCVLENNSIGWPLKSAGGYTSMYDRIISLGKPITFQTETACKIEDWRGTLDWALDTAHAYAVELPSANCTKDGVTYYGYKHAATYPVNELTDYNNRFRAQP